MSSLLGTEINQTAELISHQLKNNTTIIADIVKDLKANPPAFVYTIARGSSDNAAYFAKYLFAMQTGLITASLPPSLESLYNNKLQVKGSLALAISQSGASPDICSSLHSARKNGARTLAIVNNTDSQLAAIADHVIPIGVGEERALAATKSFIGSLTCCIQLIATLANDNSLLDALNKLPEALTQAAESPWHDAISELTDAVNLITIARGIGYPIAREAALKLKETCNIHAEPFSAAEFQHGPMALAAPDFPLLFFAQDDVTLPHVLALCQKMTNLGANTMLAVANNIEIDSNACRIQLPVGKSLHPILDPIISLQSFYHMIEPLANARGCDPDSHENLRKVTETK